jgi:hypothetical protein
MMASKSGSPAEIGVFALLALLSDPDAVAQRLAALQTATAEAEAATVKMQESVQAAGAVGAQAAELQAKAASAVEEAAERLRIAQAAQIEATAREQALDARGAKLAQGEKDATAFADDLGKRQLAIGAREQSLEIEEEAVTELKADYEGRLARLQAVAAGA